MTFLRTHVRRRKILPLVRNTVVVKFQCCAWLMKGPTIALIGILTNEHNNQHKEIWHEW
jgi:hypothetical protein